MNKCGEYVLQIFSLQRGNKSWQIAAGIKADGVGLSELCQSPKDKSDTVPLP